MRKYVLLISTVIIIMVRFDDLDTNYPPWREFKHLNNHKCLPRSPDGEQKGLSRDQHVVFSTTLPKKDLTLDFLPYFINVDLAVLKSIGNIQIDTERIFIGS